MTMRGRVQDGAIIIDGGLSLPEGAIVDLEVRQVQHTTLYERMKHLCGIVDGLPSDLAENHDHYIHGTAKGNDD